jgi:hypothetical protein
VCVALARESRRLGTTPPRREGAVLVLTSTEPNFWQGSDKFKGRRPSHLLEGKRAGADVVESGSPGHDLPFSYLNVLTGVSSAVLRRADRDLGNLIHDEIALFGGMHAIG